MKPTLLQLGLFIFLTSIQRASAQDYPLRFQHLSVEDGLSFNLTYAITQDKHGFIWLGTMDGLNRFDGNRVEVYRQKLGDKTSLPGNSIVCLFTDSRGIVWIGTANGLAYFDYHTNSFRTFINNPKDINSLPGNFINTIGEDSRGVLWIGTAGQGGQGLCSFDIKNNRFQRFLKNDKAENSISSNGIEDIKFAPDGSMWIATSNGLNRFDLTTGKFKTFYANPADSSALSINYVPRIAIGKDGNLWMGFISGDKLHLDRFNTNTFRCRRFVKLIEKQKANINSFYAGVFPGIESRVSPYVDNKGRLWIGSIALGLSLFIPDQNIFYQYKTDPLDPASLQSNSICGIYEDHSGMIWLTTLAGADRCNPDESKFALYRSQSSGFFSPVKKSVQAFAEDTLHRLWIGTSEGLFILDRNTGKFSHYQWNQNDAQSLHGNFITAICRDRQGNMWMGTGNGLKLFDPAHNKVRIFFAENNNQSLASNAISSIVCDKNGDLLIGSLPGFTIYYTQTHRFVNFNNDTLHPMLNNRRNYVVFEDNRGVIWLGTPGRGLAMYNPQKGTIKNFTNKSDDASSLAAALVCSFTQDHEGKIWIGTGGGLSCFDEKNQRFTNFTDKNGLPNVRVKQLLVDDKDRIWMATNRGISMLDASRKIFTNYDPSDGLQGWDFSEPSAFKTHDGYFCYGGSSGFNMFHPDSLKKNLFIPPVMLKAITIFDQPLNIDSSYSDLKSLNLSYKQNFFSFEFAALNYDHPEKNQYACQLVPFDKQMRRLGTNHSISYTNVPPGHYTLKVKASNNDGIWNEKGYELPLTIVPPFWATTWFKVMVIGLLIGAVFLFLMLRDKRIRKEQARQIAINKQIAEVRMTALQAQMNPHFIFNSLNSIQHLISIREKEEAISYLSKFSKLIRKTLESSRENAVPVSNELESLVLYIQLEQLRFNHKFDYHISIDEKIDKENTEIPPLLIQPYVENAILHGLVNKEDKGDLWLSFDRNNGSLVCKIEDNGVGRGRAEEIEKKKVEKHKSLGIIVTNERISTLASLLDYNIKVEIEDLFETQQTDVSPRPTGTRVTILIPVKHAE